MLEFIAKIIMFIGAALFLIIMIAGFHDHDFFELVGLSVPEARRKAVFLGFLFLVPGYGLLKIAHIRRKKLSNRLG